MEPTNNGNGRRRRPSQEHEERGDRRSIRREQRSRSRARNDGRGGMNRGMSRPRGMGNRDDGAMIRQDRHRSRSGIRGERPMAMRESMSILQNYLAECEDNLVECELRRRQLAQMVGHVLDFRQMEHNMQSENNVEERPPRPFPLPDQMWDCAERQLEAGTRSGNNAIRSFDFMPLPLGPDGNPPQGNAAIEEEEQLDLPLPTSPQEINILMDVGDGFHVMQERSPSLSQSGENNFAFGMEMRGNNVERQGPRRGSRTPE